MMDREFEDTKPIKVDETPEQITRSSRTPVMDEEESSRSEKYKEVMEDDKKEILAREYEEKIEEELAEKNINEAEKILHEEKVAKENKAKLVEFEDDDFSIMDKFKKMPKKSKILIISLVILFLVLLIVLIAVLVIKFGGGKSAATNTGSDAPIENEYIYVEDEPPVIVDNYYYEDGTLHLLDSKLEEIGTYECTNQDENLCYVAFNNSTDTLNSSILVRDGEKGDVKERLPIIEDEFAFINDSNSENVNNINLYSISTGEIKGTYRDVKTYSDGYVIVKGTDNKYGLLQVNDTMKVLLSNQYDYLGMLNGAEFLVAKNSKDYYLLNKVGKAVSSTVSGTVKYYSSSLIVTNVGKEYNVYDLEGNMLEGAYDFATVNGNYMALVKEGKVFIKDKDKNKYNEEGIALKNDVYVKTYTYDDEDNLVSSKLSFALNVTDKKMELVVYENDLKDGEYTQFNLKTPEINGAYKYLNYFEGKLYFYSDEAKENLIGSYTCANKNLINEETTLDNCYPGRDTVYESGDSRKSTIPIINERYVFIQDGLTINLYDLKNRKQLVSYTSVNSYTENNDYTMSHYEGDLNVVALNKKGQYGMITVTADSASTAYKFQYNKMEKLKDYIIAQDTESKWIMLFDKSSTTGKFSGKILDYTKDKKQYLIDIDGLYYIYDVNGDMSISLGFKNLKMYSDYFVGIDGESKLNIYNYSGDLITSEPLAIGGYSCSLSEGFKVEYKNKNYIVSVCDGETYKEFVYDTSKDKYLIDDKKEESSSDENEENTEAEESLDDEEKAEESTE
ncbi:MAG: hypothetical protein IJ475_01840 [Bacilli bacterium]|nr:hypothetical protein [Bacilli bacterium]